MHTVMPRGSADAHNCLCSDRTNNPNPRTPQQTISDTRRSFRSKSSKVQVKARAECIGSSRYHRRSPVPAYDNKKNRESSEISITKRLEPTVAVLFWSNRLPLEWPRFRRRLRAVLLHQTSSHLWSEARDKSSKPRPAAQAHWLELSKVNMLGLPFLSRTASALLA